MEEAILFEHLLLGQPLAEGIQQPERHLEVRPRHIRDRRRVERRHERRAHKLLRQPGVHARNILEERRELAAVGAKRLLGLVRVDEIKIVRVHRLASHDE